MKRKEKEEAIRLRKLGYSYNEIIKLLPVAISSLSLWLRSIELNDEAKQRLFNRSTSCEHLTKWTNDNKEKQSSILKKYYSNLSDKVKKEKLKFLLSTVIPASRMCFTKIETPAKLTLDKLFNTNFKKETVNNKIIDFANENFVIEHTIDNGKGIRCALDRLNQISDGRIKILICPSYGFGHKRKSEVVDLYHWPLDLFNEEIIPDAIKEKLNVN